MQLLEGDRYTRGFSNFTTSLIGGRGDSFITAQANERMRRLKRLRVKRSMVHFIRSWIQVQLDRCWRSMYVFDVPALAFDCH